MVQLYRVPSKSRPGTFREVEARGDMLLCDCPATVKCTHVRIVEKYLGAIQGNPEKCFYTGDPRHLDEHHLLRGVQRQKSLTVYITRWIHTKATLDKEFELHLTDLYFRTLEDMTPIKVEATVKEVSIKNLVSGDKGIRVLLYSGLDAMKLGRVPEDKMVIVDFKGSKIYGLIKSVGKQVLKDNDYRVNILLDIPTGEAPNAVLLGLLDNEEVVEVRYEEK